MESSGEYLLRGLEYYLQLLDKQRTTAWFSTIFVVDMLMKEWDFLTKKISPYLIHGNEKTCSIFWFLSFLFFFFSLQFFIFISFIFFFFFFFFFSSFFLFNFFFFFFFFFLEKYSDIVIKMFKNIRENFLRLENIRPDNSQEIFETGVLELETLRWKSRALLSFIHKMKTDIEDSCLFEGSKIKKLIGALSGSSYIKIEIQDPFSVQEEKKLFQGFVHKQLGDEIQLIKLMMAENIHKQPLIKEWEWEMEYKGTDSEIDGTEFPKICFSDDDEDWYSDSPDARTVNNSASRHLTPDGSRNFGNQIPPDSYYLVVFSPDEYIQWSGPTLSITIPFSIPQTLDSFVLPGQIRIIATSSLAVTSAREHFLSMQDIPNLELISPLEC